MTKEQRELLEFSLEPIRKRGREVTIRDMLRGPAAREAFLAVIKVFREYLRDDEYRVERFGFLSDFEVKRLERVCEEMRSLAKIERDGRARRKRRQSRLARK